MLKVNGIQELTRDEVLFKLNALVRELTCMNQEEFGKLLSKNNFDITIERFSFGEPSKIATTIMMSKKEIEL